MTSLGVAVKVSTQHIAALQTPPQQQRQKDQHTSEQQKAIYSRTVAMPDKRMRPIVKQEPGSDGAQELPQPQQAAAAAAGEREGRRRRGDMGEEGAELELEVQLLRENAEAQAFALQGMERAMAMGEELLHAKVQVAELRAEIRIKDAALESEVRSREAALQAKDAVHKAHVALLESKLQSKDDALEAKDAVLRSKDSIIEAKDFFICRLRNKSQRRDKVAQHVSAQATAGSAAAAFPPISIPFTKCVVNPRDMSADVKQFFESTGLVWCAYLHQPEMEYSASGTIRLSETGLTLTKSRRSQSIPNEFGYEDISCIKTTIGSDEIRHVYFQTSLGHIFTLDVRCGSGDYSKFRT